MTENTSIPWCDHTLNFWMGCHKKNAACKNCYMYRDMPRYGRDPYDVRKTGEATWSKAFDWDRRAGERGVKEKVFACSWSDFFIVDADPWRPDAWEVIRNTVNLIWIIPTKRPERIAACLPPDWGAGWPNVWFLVSVHDQPSADLFIPQLLKVPAAVHGVSYEPGLGPVDWMPWLVPECRPHWAKGYQPRKEDRQALAALARAGAKQMDWHLLDWIIFGFESGPKARPGDLQWIRDGIDQCRFAGIAPFVKQLGSVWARENKAKDRKGENPAEWPADLRVREFPRVV